MPSELKRRSRTRLLRFAAASVLGILMMSFLIAWIVAGRLMAPANRPVGAPDDLPVVAFEIESKSGSTIVGWSLAKEPGDPVLILLHPIRGNRSSMLGRAKLFCKNGFSVVLIDLQAHGESPGEFITLGHREKRDVEAAVKYVKASFPNSRIGIVGWSLGGASALLASPLDVDAMVLESVYPTISDAVYDRVDMRIGSLKYVVAPMLLNQLPIRLGISSDDLRPIDFIDKVDCPVMVLAGDRDLHTPMKESQALFDAAKETKAMEVFTGASHVDLLAFDEKRYQEKVVPFLRKHLGSDR